MIHGGYTTKKQENAHADNEIWLEIQRKEAIKMIIDSPRAPRRILREDPEVYQAALSV